MSIYTSPWRNEETDAIFDVAEKFFAKEILPNREKFELQQCVDRAVWRKAGSLGLICCAIPEEYGGGGGTIAHDFAVAEAQARSGDSGFGIVVHGVIIAHYILAYGTEEQKQRWLPKMASGEWIASVAMTEPSGGSDLAAVKTTAIRDGDEYVINGSKTFISNGSNSDLIILVAKTDPTAGAKGISLIGVETKDLAGFTRGRILEKVGMHSADTSELFFENVLVPVGNLLGEVEGKGFVQLMTQLAQERLTCGIVAVNAMEVAVEETIAYTKSRNAFDKSVFDFQNSKFVLAEAKTVAHVSRVYLDQTIERHMRGEVDATEAAMVKWWLSEQQCQVIDKCLQLFGGYGYMREYPIARMYEDARVQKIYGGTNEIMKDIISRSL